MTNSSELQAHSAQPSITIKTHTPDGTLFTTIVEELDAPRQVLLNIGKSGHSLQAWADALARVITLALRSGLTLNSIIAEISNISTERRSFSNGTTVRSGPEGLAHALLKYVSAKYVDQSDERPSRLDAEG